MQYNLCCLCPLYSDARHMAHDVDLALKQIVMSEGGKDEAAAACSHSQEERYNAWNIWVKAKNAEVDDAIKQALTPAPDHAKGEQP